MKAAEDHHAVVTDESILGRASVAGSLPPGWSVHIDEDTGVPFYTHVSTGSTQWTKPTNTTDAEDVQRIELQEQDDSFGDYEQEPEVDRDHINDSGSSRSGTSEMKIKTAPTAVTTSSSSSLSTQHHKAGQFPVRNAGKNYHVIAVTMVIVMVGAAIAITDVFSGYCASVGAPKSCGLNTWSWWLVTTMALGSLCNAMFFAVRPSVLKKHVLPTLGLLLLVCALVGVRAPARNDLSANSVLDTGPCIYLDGNAFNPQLSSDAVAFAKECDLTNVYVRVPPQRSWWQANHESVSTCSSSQWNALDMLITDSLQPSVLSSVRQLLPFAMDRGAGNLWRARNGNFGAVAWDGRGSVLQGVVETCSRTSQGFMCQQTLPVCDSSCEPFSVASLTSVCKAKELDCTYNGGDYTSTVDFTSFLGDGDWATGIRDVLSTLGIPPATVYAVLYELQHCGNISSPRALGGLRCYDKNPHALVDLGFGLLNSSTGEVDVRATPSLPQLDITYFASAPQTVSTAAAGNCNISSRGALLNAIHEAIAHSQLQPPVPTDALVLELVVAPALVLGVALLVMIETCRDQHKMLMKSHDNTVDGRQRQWQQPQPSHVGVNQRYWQEVIPVWKATPLCMVWSRLIGSTVLCLSVVVLMLGGLCFWLGQQQHNIAYNLLFNGLGLIAAALVFQWLLWYSHMPIGISNKRGCIARLKERLGIDKLSYGHTSYYKKIIFSEAVEVSGQVINLLTVASTTDWRLILTLVVVLSANLVVLPVCVLIVDNLKSLRLQNAALLADTLLDCVYFIVLLLTRELRGMQFGTAVVFVIPVISLLVTYRGVASVIVGGRLREHIRQRIPSLRPPQEMVKTGTLIGSSSFTPSGTATATPNARAETASETHVPRWIKGWCFVQLAVSIVLFVTTVVRIVQQGQACESLVGRDTWKASSPQVLFSSGFFQPTVCGLQHVTTLNVHGTNVDSTLLSLVVGLYPNLVSLDLSNSSVSRVPKHITQLTQLRSLNVKHNRITYVEPDVFRVTSLNIELTGNPFMTNVDWSGEPIDRLPQGFLRVVGPTLQVLNVSHTSFYRLRLSNLQQLPHLRVVDMSYCNVAEFGSYTSTPLPSLVLLRLSHNNIKAVPDSIPLYSILTNSSKTVDLSYNQLEGVGVALVGLHGRVVLEGNSDGNLAFNIPQDASALFLRHVNPFVVTLPSVQALTTLVLAGDFSSLPSELGLLTNLTQLRIRSEQLTALPPEMTALQGLSQWWLNVDFVPSAMPYAKELCALIVRGAGCCPGYDEVEYMMKPTMRSHLGPGYFSDFPKLKYIWNSISAEPSTMDVAAFSGLTQLEALDLWNNYNLHDVPEGAFPDTVKYLDLPTGVSLSALSNLVCLEKLYTAKADATQLNLYGTQVADVAPFSTLTALKQLNLYDTQVVDVSSLAHLSARIICDEM